MQKQERTRRVSTMPDTIVQEMKLTGIVDGEVNTLNQAGIVYGNVEGTGSRKASAVDEEAREPLPHCDEIKDTCPEDGTESRQHKELLIPSDRTMTNHGPKKMMTGSENLNVIAVKSGRAETAIAAGIIYGDVNIHGTVEKNGSVTRIPDTLRINMANAASIFEETQAYQRVLQTLNDHGHVVIAGSPGSGKTTMSLYIMKEYANRNYTLRYEENIKEFSLGKVDLQKDTLLVFDDVFGSFSLTQDAHLYYPKLFKDIEGCFQYLKMKLLDKERGSENCQSIYSMEVSLKVIFCTRTNILKDIFPWIKKFRGNLFKQNTIVNLTTLAKLNNEEKKKILHKHLTNHNIGLSPEEIEIIANKEYATLGFPYICQLFVEDGRNCQHSVDFFERPLHYFDIYISEMFEVENSKYTAAVMLFTLLKDGVLDLSRDTDVINYSQDEADALFEKLKEVVPELEKESFLQKMRRHAENQVGTLLMKEGDLAKFCHPTIHDALGYVVGSKNPCFVLRNCSLTFIIERIRVSNESDDEFNTGDEYDFMVKLQRQSVDILLLRLAEEVLEGNFALALSHYCLRKAENANNLYRKISTKGKFSDIIHKTDEDHGLCLLFWIAFSGNNALCSLVFSDTECDKKKYLDGETFAEWEIFEALLGSCMSGNLEGLQILLKHCDKSQIDKVHSISLGDILKKDTETKYAYRKIVSKCNKTPKEEISADLDVPRMYGDKRDKLIHIAAANGFTDIVATLVGVGVEIDSTGGTNMTPLMYACCFGHRELAESLLHQGADFKLLDEEGDNCLHLASRGGFIDIIEILLNTGCNINSRGCRDRTPLMLASYGKLDAVKYLLERGALTEPDNSYVEYKDNCLHIAARGALTGLVQILIEEGEMNMEIGGELKRTPVIVACRQGHLENAQYLASKGANLRVLDKNGSSCLHLAATAGHNKVVTWLLESLNLVSVDCCNAFKRTPLMYAFQYGHSETVHLLLERGADAKLKDEKCNACIHFAARSGVRSLVESCIAFGQSINCRNNTGVTPLLNACQYGVIPMARFLLDMEADVTLKDENGGSCSHAACYGGHIEVVQVLLDSHVFDIRSLDKFGVSPFITAVMADKAPLVKYLVLTYPFLKSQLNDRYQNALHVACRSGASNTVVELVQAGIDVNAQDNDMRTPLMFALSTRKSIVDVVTLLVMAEADTTLRDSLGATCLHAAIKTAGHISMTEALLDMDADINIRGAFGESPLMLACRRNANEYFDLLLNKGANVKLVDNKRATALHHVCMAPEDNTYMVSRLLEKDPACVNRSDMHGRTPAWHAVRNGKVHTLRQLISKGANLCLFDKRGSSLLHSACKNDRVNLNIVRILVDNGANVNCRNRYGQTPVMLAAQNGHDEAIEILVVKGADLRIVDVQNLSPIDHAKMNKHYHVAGKLQVTVYRQLYPRRYFRRY